MLEISSWPRNSIFLDLREAAALVLSILVKIVAKALAHLCQLQGPVRAGKLEWLAALPRALRSQFREEMPAIQIMYTTSSLVETEKEVAITTKDDRLDLSSKRVEGGEEDGL